MAVPEVVPEQQPPEEDGAPPPPPPLSDAELRTLSAEPHLWTPGAPTATGGPTATTTPFSAAAIREQHLAAVRAHCAEARRSAWSEAPRFATGRWDDGGR